MTDVPTLMIQGTSSHAGKSLTVAGLCRLFSRRGLVVRPFKPQNMSNNAAVTVDGGEIGRAQALQARACGTPATIHMNPVLLKPTGEVGAQVIVQGRVVGNASAKDYHLMKPGLMAPVLESLERLKREADLVIVEGAGSPAEANLRQGDIANMGLALAADVPVVLVGDIERGGVLAQIVGTMALLTSQEQALVRGYVVNKFRGDPGLFDGALPIIEAHTGLGCLGVVPYLDGLQDLPAEDVLGLEERPCRPGAPIRIAVPRLPRIANFDDLDPLAAEADVDLQLIQPGRAIPGDCDLVLLPGSKATIADLAALRAAGFDIDILAHVRRGGQVLGLCGGYQMLGRSIADPDGIEGPAATVPGLGLLAVDTVLRTQKHLGLVEGRELASGLPIRGYEIHLGQTTGSATPWLEVQDRPAGAIDPTGRIMGSYVHGIMASDAFRQRFLGRLRDREPSAVDYEARVEAALDRLADHLERHLDIARLEAIAGITTRGGSARPPARRP